MQRWNSISVIFIGAQLLIESSHVYWQTFSFQDIIFYFSGKGGIPIVTFFINLHKLTATIGFPLPSLRN